MLCYFRHMTPHRASACHPIFVTCIQHPASTSSRLVSLLCACHFFACQKAPADPNTRRWKARGRFLTTTDTMIITLLLTPEKRLLYFFFISEAPLCHRPDGPWLQITSSPPVVPRTLSWKPEPHVWCQRGKCSWRGLYDQVDLATCWQIIVLLLRISSESCQWHPTRHGTSYALNDESSSIYINNLKTALLGSGTASSSSARKVMVTSTIIWEQDHLLLFSILYPFWASIVLPTTPRSRWYQ